MLGHLSLGFFLMNYVNIGAYDAVFLMSLMNFLFGFCSLSGHSLADLSGT